MLESRTVDKGLSFPQGFLWGAATSAFQTEGNVTNSDWWRWEQTALPPSYRSGRAIDHYHRFEADFELLKMLSHNAHRFGIEWSRIEPSPNNFDQQKIKHYSQVIKALNDRGMRTMLTLHHFTNPAWFADSGGWENPKAPFIFERFVKRVVPELAEEGVDYWLTINEHNVYTNFAYLTGEFPPQKVNLLSSFKAYWNMSRAHKKAYQNIHREVPQAQVGMANAVVAFSEFHQRPPIRQPESLIVKSANFMTNKSFYALTPGFHDFLGLNYYMGYSFRLNNLQRPVVTEYLGEDESLLGWKIYPQGLSKIISQLKIKGLPIYITENGIATKDDSQRERFLIAHLKEIHSSIQQGADIRGYFHWSAFDNMELHRGYEPTFGLVGVDLTTLQRTPKPSAYLYRQIIENNGIPQDLLTH